MVQNSPGMHFVRPPLLKFKKVNEDSKCKTYDVTTFRTPKDRDPKATHPAELTGVTDSFIFCNEKMKIKVPKKSFMIRNGKKKFAYAFGMFPNPKNGKAAYLDGCILGALGLKRQKTFADVICFVTPDITKDVRDKLKIVFDKVIVVPYISPYDMPGKGKLKTIKMDPKIFQNCPNYTKQHPYSHVFFKLHIFNPDLFPYEKVCFVDSDLVPMNFYDSLFMLDTPAGWVEYRKKIPYDKSFNWDRCDFLEHGSKIPKIFTDIDGPGGADVNAGLMVVKPDYDEYSEMIAELTSPLETWMGEDKLHKGFHNFDFDSPVGQQFVKDSYCYPEQNYLTKRYSGEWTYVEFAFQSWTLDPCNSFGIHMAAFNPKPWFKQPADSEVKIKEDFTPYHTRKNKEMFADSEIAKALALDNEEINFENISISYELFNDLIIWGLVSFPELHKFFMMDTEIHGTKVSFDRDIFKPLVKGTQFKTFKQIKKGDEFYKKLSVSQKYIHRLLHEYDEFVLDVKDKFLSICKTMTKDRYGKYVVDNTMINYPDYKELSSAESSQLLKEGIAKMPFGRFKGVPLKELEEEYVEKLVTYKAFQNNKELREALRDTKFKKLVPDESDFDDLTKPLKSRGSKKKGKKKKQKKKKDRRTGRKKKDKDEKEEKEEKSSRRTKRKTKGIGKGNKILIYFHMPNCKFCDEFETMWTALKKKKKGKGILFRKLDGTDPKNSEYVNTFGIESYPTLVLVKGTTFKKYKKERTMKGLMGFIN